MIRVKRVHRVAVAIGLLAATFTVTAQPLHVDDQVQAALCAALESQAHAINDPQLLEAAKGATALLGIHVKQRAASASVVIQTSGPAHYAAFSEENGYRQVVELPGVVSVMGSQLMHPEDKAFVRAIRTRLAPREGKLFTKVILDLTRPADLSVEPCAEGLEVLIQPGHPATAPAPTAETPAATPAVFQSVNVASIDFGTDSFARLAAPADTEALTPEPDTTEADQLEEETAQPAMTKEEPAEAPPVQMRNVGLAPDDNKAQVRPKSSPPARAQISPASLSSDPLYQKVTIDFRDMELSNVVALLAQKAGINVIAGPEVSLTAPVTAFLKDVPLLTAMETVLRMSQLGVVEEEGIFRIVSYDEAIASRRLTRMVYLQNGTASEVSDTLLAVSKGMPESGQISIANNESTNVVIISGPEDRVTELEELAYQLDVAEPTLATITQAIKLNYADPQDILPVIEGMLTPEGVGSVEADERSRHLIVTDIPIVIEQVRGLIESLDTPVKQVAIEAMVIDAVLRDDSQTGVTWLLDLMNQRDRSGNIVGILPDHRTTRGLTTGSTEDLNLGGNLGGTAIGSPALDAGVLTLGVLTGALDFRGAIAAEVASSNAEILANPVVVTVENKDALIQIVQDFPYQEITQSTQGPPVATTAFKEIGIELNVRPRVTHDNDIIVTLDAKQSSVSGLTADGIPIEDKRVAQNTLRTSDNRTIFIGGLRNINHQMDVSKIPVLGDVPVVNFLFRSTDIEKTHTELLIFLTCHVIGETLPELTPQQQVEHDRIKDVPRVPDSQRSLFRDLVNPGEMRDPAWKWRRTP